MYVVINSITHVPAQSHGLFRLYSIKAQVVSSPSLCEREGRSMDLRSNRTHRVEYFIQTREIISTGDTIRVVVISQGLGAVLSPSLFVCLYVI